MAARVKLAKGATRIYLKLWLLMFILRVLYTKSLQMATFKGGIQNEDIFNRARIY